MTRVLYISQPPHCKAAVSDVLLVDEIFFLPDNLRLHCVYTLRMKGSENLNQNLPVLAMILK